MILRLLLVLTVVLLPSMVGAQVGRAESETATESEAATEPETATGSENATGSETATESETATGSETATESEAADAGEPDLSVRADTLDDEDDGPSDAAPASNSLADDLRQRETLRPWHIGVGTATVGAAYLTTILGFMTYSDRYGFDGPTSSGCATGSPILGQDNCQASPHLVHPIAAFTTTALFVTSFSLALFMPDPLGAADGDGELATLLTIHKALRWGLAGVFLAQLVLGFVTTALQSDYNTQRDVATAHLVLGTVTNIGLTTQGVIGSMMAW